MEQMRRVGGLVSIVAVLLWAVSAHAQLTLRAGNLEPADHSVSKGIDKFAELVATKTNGQVKIETFHASVLGSEREMIEGVKGGSLDITASASGLQNFVRGLSVFELPYLYNNLDHLYRVWLATAPNVEKLASQAGFRVLTAFYQGPRFTVSKRPIRTFDDMKGLRLRVPESPLYVGMARALGANPTPTAYAEVYTSLQTGVVDAAECPLENIWTTKWYEPAKYLAATEHISYPYYLVMNQNAFQKLTPSQRTAFQEAAKEVSLYQLNLTKESNTALLEKIKAAGTTIISNIERKPFAQALEPFNKSFAQKIGPEAVSLLDKIQSIK